MMKEGRNGASGSKITEDQFLIMYQTLIFSVTAVTFQVLFFSEHLNQNKHYSDHREKNPDNVFS